ncbi:MAG: hypothetical protein KC621_15980 [Myxococcales bacterium]|nr:hypothetical protein [Myxococcales bacterium]
MPRYLCLQRTLSAETAERPSPAQMEGMMEEFRSWAARFDDQLVDLGGRLGAGRLLTDATPTDGPFVEVKELVGGYMIVEADDLESACAVAHACPGLVGPRSGVEVVEIRRS